MMNSQENPEKVYKLAHKNQDNHTQVFFFNNFFIHKRKKTSNKILYFMLIFYNVNKNKNICVYIFKLIIENNKNNDEKIHYILLLYIDGYKKFLSCRYLWICLANMAFTLNDPIVTTITSSYML